MKKNKLAIALGLSASVGLIGCNGDSSSSSDTTQTTTPATSTSYSVTAIDGYLRGAQVWLDLNSNFQLDNGEPSATSETGGIAKLDVTNVSNPERYPVVVKAIAGQTIDEDQGLVTTNYVMSAPAGETDITPLSTLVHVILEQASTGGETTEQIEALKQEAILEVSEQLGIEMDEVLGDFIESGIKDVAFIAENIVSSNVLPSTPEELETVADQDSSTSTFKKQSAAVTDKIKKTVAIIEASGGTPDFENANAVFDETADFVQDSDSDGVPDFIDVFPADGNEWLDIDEDGTGDNADLDDDNDGVDDLVDAFPLNPDESVDTDNDFIGNNTDLDDDNDGVLDNEDTFPLDSTEFIDTDGDGTGNNADLDDDNDGVNDTADAFPLDENETLDTDNDNIGNNTDTDDDNDGVLDNEDAFELDPTESIDTDNDGIGNNADTDDDNDGVSDDEDAFDLDPAESIDTDNDGIGNNTDTDDDGDGVSDDVDVDPLDPNVGLSDVAKVIQFMRESNSFYTFWDDSSEDIAQLYLETFEVNGDSAPLTALQRINSKGTLISLATGEDSDYQLTESGWTEIPVDYTLDFSNDELTAYPTAFPTIKFTVTAVLKELSNLNIHNNNFGLEFIENQDVLYPEGSTSAELTFTPQSDTYYLWTDWAPWVLRGEGQESGPDGTSLDEIQVDTSIGEIADVNTFVGASVGYDATVELVTDNTAHFYTMDWSGGTATRIASATWSLESLNGEQFILFTVPDQAVQQWGDKFDQDSAHILFSVLNNTLYMGSLEKANIPEDETSTFLNASAKDAFLNYADIPISKCSVNNVDDGTATFEQFEAAVTACGGLTPITADMVIGQNFHRVKGNGETRDYFFNADGSMNGLGNEADPWEIQGDYLVVNYQNGGHWYWALVEHDDNTWSLKFYEIDTSTGEEQYLIWADTVDLNDTQPCQLLDGMGYTYEEYRESINNCSSQLPDINEQDIMGQTFSRFKGNGESRSYYFEGDYTAIDYRNGLPRDRFWEFNNDGLLVVYYDQAKQEVAEYIAFTNESGSELDFTFYVSDEGEQEVWTSTYTEVSPNTIVECETDNTGWNDDLDVPLNTVPIADYHSAVSACKSQGEGNAHFSTEYFDRNIAFTSDTTGENDEFETYQFYELANGEVSGTGKYLTADEDMDMTWSVDDATNLVTVTLTDGVNTATDTLAITSSNGVDFSLKGFSRATDWDGVEDTSEGDIWSHIFHVTSF